MICTVARSALFRASSEGNGVGVGCARVGDGVGGIGVAVAGAGVGEMRTGVRGSGVLVATTAAGAVVGVVVASAVCSEGFSRPLPANRVPMTTSTSTAAVAPPM